MQTEQAFVSIGIPESLADGDILIVYEEQRLDSAIGLEISRAANLLSAIFDNGVRISLGTASEPARHLLTECEEVLFTRQSSEGLVGKLMPVVLC